MNTHDHSVLSMHWVSGSLGRNPTASHEQDQQTRK